MFISSYDRSMLEYDIRHLTRRVKRLEEINEALMLYLGTAVGPHPAVVIQKRREEGTDG